MQKQESLEEKYMSNNISLANLSIKRPIFITCVIFLMLVLGYISFKKMPVDLFPNVEFPIVLVTIPYPGAGPSEIETLISKPVEEEISTLPGVKHLYSTSQEGFAIITAEFNLETDIKYAEQKIKDRIASVKSKLPKDIKEPTIRTLNPADQPVLILAINADMDSAKLYDFVNLNIKSKIEQVNQVGLVEIIGGRKREIQVQLDRNALKAHELSASRVVQALSSAGQNIPSGKVTIQDTDTVIRTLGEFRTLKDIGSTAISFFGNDKSVLISDVAVIKDTLEEEKTRSFYNGKPCLSLYVYRQSGSNTIAVVNAVKKQVEKLNASYKTNPENPKIVVTRDGSKMIHANVEDVKESIMIGVILTILVVYLFLGNIRSTFITSLALPNSLIGAFFLMQFSGFSINIMTLLALSLSVGLLIDDAIVVRENIFRHMEMGKHPLKAALDGTKEVSLAVIATTLAVISVFGPIAFLQGVVGQFFKQFGLTICFAMAISLFDALTIAPMLSAYFAGNIHKKPSKLWYYTFGYLERGFSNFQDYLELKYEKLLHFTLKAPLLIIGLSLVLFVSSIYVVKKVPKTFLPAQDIGEFMISLELPQGSSLDKTAKIAHDVDALLRRQKEVKDLTLLIGSSQGESNVASLYVNMVSAKERKVNTSEFKAFVRNALKPYAQAKPIVKDVDMVGGGQRPFNLNIKGSDLKTLEEISNKVYSQLKNHPALLDAELSYKVGKPEFQVQMNTSKADRFGVTTAQTGLELRTQIEGNVAGIYRENGFDYDIRVKMSDSYRNLKEGYPQTYVPNLNNTLVKLENVSNPVSTTGPANITRQDKSRYIQIAADIAPNGPGIGGVMKDIQTLFQKDIKLPEGFSYAFVGQAENFQELASSMAMAAFLGILFIFLVLSSLYESFITPFTIMLVLPLAICGAFFGLFITGKSLDLFSMIGCIMLLGIATKNSILLVDYANQLVQEGLSFKEAIIKAGKVRLRPILMTTLALIAGMLPIAIGLNEASRQRTSMGVAVIGGLISSTLLSLVLIPAVYSYIERFREWSLSLMKKWVS